MQSADLYLWKLSVRCCVFIFLFLFPVV